MSYRSELESWQAHVTTLQRVLSFTCLVILGMGLMLLHALKTQSLVVPPDLRQGAVMRIGEVAPPSVYNFAYYILQQVYRWPNDGQADFAKNIFALQALLTPRFRVSLEKEMRGKNNAGELRGRVRGIQEHPGRNYSEARVVIESDGSWLVILDMDVLETMDGMLVKQASVRYTVRVVRYDVDAEQNPWGLALDGYVGQGPSLLSAEDLAKEFTR